VCVGGGGDGTGHLAYKYVLLSFDLIEQSFFLVSPSNNVIFD
jgi:hypothetical protein